MWNKKLEIDARQYHTTQAVTKETVIEKTISPDKVVEMYDKVENTHAKNLLSTYRIEGNKVSGLVCEVKTNNLTNQKEIWLVFKIDEFIKQISTVLAYGFLEGIYYKLLK